MLGNIHSNGHTPDELRTFDRQFIKFLREHDYPGGALGVMKNGKLLHAQGYGKIPGSHSIKPNTQLPISSLSKSITAAAILKLVQFGELELSTKVFGDDGVLRRVRQLRNHVVDVRIYDITVSHLLHHTAGWDQSVGPMYDPMLNSLYLSLGHKVPDIASKLNIHGTLAANHIIRYMFNQPLTHVPGTQYRYSNLGYCILGRIIEEVTGEKYDKFVKDTILTPLGMWHTQIGPNHKTPSDVNEVGNDLNSHTPDLSSEISIQKVHATVSPSVVDSTLGWYSTVHDILRFVGGLDGTGSHQLLTSEFLQLLFQHPGHGTMQHVDTWPGAGFTIKNDGSFWQEGDEHDNDVVLFHQGIKNWFNDNRNTSKTKKGGLTFVAIMASNNHVSLRQPLRKLISKVKQWPAGSAIDGDLYGSQHGQHIAMDNTELIIQTKLPGHHLVAYMNAAKHSGYFPQWISSYSSRSRTFFIVILKKVKRIVDYTVELHVSPDQFHPKLQTYAAQGYHVDWLHSYSNHGNRENRNTLMLMVKKEAENVVMEIGANVTYYTLIAEKKQQKGYTPLVQSMDTHHGISYVTYLLKAPRKYKVKTYTDLTWSNIEEKVRSLGLSEYNLVYLDPYTTADGTTKLSAIFERSGRRRWVIQKDLTTKGLARETERLKSSNLLPYLVIGYESNGRALFFAMWQKP